MTVAPIVQWSNVSCAGHYQWNGQGGGQPPGPITIPRATTIHFAVQTLGSTTFTITGDCLNDDVWVWNCSDQSQLAVGQTIQCAAIPKPTEHCTWPPMITSVEPSINGFFYTNGEWTDLGGWTRNQPPATRVNGATLVISDVAPAGTLAAVVTPGTGVTLADQNFDGNSGDGSASNIGDGLVICNLAGQGEGGYFVSFANAGTYTVTTTFTTADPNFSSLTLAPPLTLTVT